MILQVWSNNWEALNYVSQNGQIPPPSRVFNWPKSPGSLGLRNMKILQWNTYTIKTIYEKSLMHFLHKNALRKFGCWQWPRKYFLWHYFGPRATPEQFSSIKSIFIYGIIVVGLGWCWVQGSATTSQKLKDVRGYKVFWFSFTSFKIRVTSLEHLSLAEFSGE